VAGSLYMSRPGPWGRPRDFLPKNSKFWFSEYGSFGWKLAPKIERRCDVSSFGSVDSVKKVGLVGSSRGKGWDSRSRVGDSRSQGAECLASKKSSGAVLGRPFSDMGDSWLLESVGLWPANPSGSWKPMSFFGGVASMRFQISVIV
jgi:hypothetical protein